VHHASNVPYLDKNMGMVLIIWDRLFGTFTEEMDEEPPRYGITSPLDNPHHPVKIIFHEWKAIGDDLKQNISLKDKLRYLFFVPGWSHDGSRKTTKQMRAAWIREQRRKMADASATKRKAKRKELEEVV
jgi:hypothetical protein